MFYLRFLLEQEHILESWVFGLKQTCLYYQKQDDNKAESLKLIGILAVNHILSGAFLKLSQLAVELLLSVIGIVDVNVRTATSLSQTTTHILVESRHNNIARSILEIVTT